MKGKVIVAAHKSYKMPEDQTYLPLQVGAAGKTGIGFQRDDTGENISAENERFCELTGIYWAWKNLDSDYIGLVHYRRYFTMKKLHERIGRDKVSLIASGEALRQLLNTYDLIIPFKRRYYIETIRSHYVHLPYTYEQDINILGQVIKELSPEYEGAYHRVMNRRWAHMFNMFVMKGEHFNRFCSWMFDILFEADRRIDTSGYTPAEKRAIAYLGEFMLDIWLEKNKIQYKEVKVLFMERQNWLRKGGQFFYRKIKAGICS